MADRGGAEDGPPRFRGILLDNTSKGAWRARAFIKGKQRNLGRYPTQEAAAQAYDCALVFFRGARDGAGLNFTRADALRALPKLLATKAFEDVLFEVGAAGPAGAAGLQAGTAFSWGPASAAAGMLTTRQPNSGVCGMMAAGGPGTPCSPAAPPLPVATPPPVLDGAAVRQVALAAATAVVAALQRQPQLLDMAPADAAAIALQQQAPQLLFYAPTEAALPCAAALAAGAQLPLRAPSLPTPLPPTPIVAAPFAPMLTPAAASKALPELGSADLAGLDDAFFSDYLDHILAA